MKLIFKKDNNTIRFNIKKNNNSFDIKLKELSIQQIFDFVYQIFNVQLNPLLLKNINIKNMRLLSLNMEKTNLKLYNNCESYDFKFTNKDFTKSIIINKKLQCEIDMHTITNFNLLNYIIII